MSEGIERAGSHFVYSCGAYPRGQIRGRRRKIYILYELLCNLQSAVRVESWRLSCRPIYSFGIMNSFMQQHVACPLPASLASALCLYLLLCVFGAFFIMSFCGLLLHCVMGIKKTKLLINIDGLSRLYTQTLTHTLGSK